jgi:hypothetical protein
MEACLALGVVAIRSKMLARQCQAQQMTLNFCGEARQFAGDILGIHFNSLLFIPNSSSLKVWLSRPLLAKLYTLKKLQLIDNNILYFYININK